MTVGLVIVSHSAQLAQGVVALAQQMTKGAVPMAAAGGADDGEGNDILGTSAERIASAIQSVDSPDGVLVLLDLGSAILSTEFALELLDDEQRAHVHLSYAPLTEGGITAAIEASMGRDVTAVQQAAEQLASVERLKLLKPFEQQDEETTQTHPTETTSQPSQQTNVGADSSRPSEPSLEASFVLANPAGLHARPASLFVRTAANFQATTEVMSHGRSAKGNSLVEILALGIRQGDTMLIRTRGVDAQSALDAVRALIEANFHETAVSAPQKEKLSALASRQVSEPSTTYGTQGKTATAPDILQGVVTSPGVAYGQALLYTSHTLKLTDVERRTIAPTDVAAEEQRLRNALDETAQELETLARQLEERIGAADAAIFDAQSLMLQDPELLETALDIIRERHNDAASALADAGEQYASQLASLSDPLLAARAVDMRDVTSKAIQHLRGQETRQTNLNTLNTPVILLAYDLTPSDTAQFRPDTILGICTVQGGRNAHAAILARALGIPALAGLDDAMLRLIHNGDEVGLDAAQGVQEDTGNLYLRPNVEVKTSLLNRMTRQQQERISQQAHARQEPLVLNGKHIPLFANVGSVVEAEAARQWGAEGIGLLRTEFLFATASTLPGEEAQRKSYAEVFRAFKGQQEGTTKTKKQRKIIVARTLDAGADKPMPALQAMIGTQNEANPALGVRGIRIHLAHPELLEQQLRALLLAAVDEQIELHIMFPMITTVEELRTSRAIFERVYEQLKQVGTKRPKRVPLGIMVEVPSAVVMADELAQLADFFSIGANDLLQYTLASDRTNAALAPLYNPMQPSALRLIRQVAAAGNRAGKPVAVCGEIASNALLAPVLIGLGVDELSMTPNAISAVRAALSGHSLQELRELAERACQASTVAEVEQ
ncbi:MAG TPA: phosphoenolpyruvate--protein phosphotransferase, partial [Ktedonobacter sp.]|nr:phosphoenolpyruvate--protein phosphotransferase [Ktedonobacter sp.]